MALDSHLLTLTPAATGQPDWTAAPLSLLVRHIVSVHHEYLKLELPKLDEGLRVVYGSYRQRDAATLAPLPGIVFLMNEELKLHMHKEESLLFPAIEQAEQVAQGGCAASFSFGSLGNPIRVLLAEHDSALGALEEIRRITRNYTVPAHACKRYRALFDSFQALERDLRVHTDLENQILFPRALALQG